MITTIALAVLAAAEVPGVRQETNNGCVEASTAAVLQLHGRAAGFWDVKKKVRSFIDGTTFFHARNATESFGLESRVFVGSEDDLRSLIQAGTPPIIILKETGGHHAVVLVALNDRHARIMDPRAGKVVEVDRRALLAKWVRARSLVFWVHPTGARAPLDRPRIERDDRRYRAAGWMILADEHDAPGPQRCELIRRALAVDATYPVAVRARAGECR